MDGGLPPDFKKATLFCPKFSKQVSLLADSPLENFIITPTLKNFIIIMKWSMGESGKRQCVHETTKE